MSNPKSLLSKEGYLPTISDGKYWNGLIPKCRHLPSQINRYISSERLGKLNRSTALNKMAKEKNQAMWIELADLKVK